jgi:hypothetical protein
MRLVGLRAKIYFSYLQIQRGISNIIVVGTADAMASDNRCFSKYDSTALVTLCGISTP